MAARFTPLEVLFTILAVGGGIAALVGDKLGDEVVLNGGLAAVIVGIILFGLTMILQRRAEISTPGSSDTDPSFHVFRGFGAVAWGIVFVIGGLLFAGSAYISITDSQEARAFFGEHPGIVITLAGVLLTSLAAAQASRATYRYHETERPTRRLGSRIFAVAWILPIGLATLAWGLVTTFAPALAGQTAAAAKDAALRLIERLAN